MIQIQPATYLLWALLLLILPVEWLAAAVTAAVVHELGHIFLLYFSGGKVTGIKVRSDGCVIETGSMGFWSQFFSILAGPTGSFGLLCLCNIMPKVALCGFFQGIYNLLPVLPFDGGRLVRLLTYRFCPKQSDIILSFMTVVVCLFILSLAAWLTVFASAGLWPTIMALMFNIRMMLRKTPCKHPGIGVQ